MGSPPSEADVPEWAAMLSTPRRALLAAMEMDTKVQGQKAAAAATPSWRAPDKLAAALARDDSPLKDGVVDEAEVATALAALQEKLRLSTGGGAAPSPPRPPDRGADEPAAAAADDGSVDDVLARLEAWRAREAAPPLSARTPRSAGESKAGDEAPFPAIASLEDEERKLQTVAFDEEERKLRDDAAEMRSAVSSLEAWREERRRETAALEARLAAEYEPGDAGGWATRAATGFEVLDLGELESLHDKALASARGARERVAGLLAGEGDAAAGPAPFGVLDYGGDALREAADLELRQLEENLAKLRAEAETD